MRVYFHIHNRATICFFSSDNLDIQLSVVLAKTLHPHKLLFWSFLGGVLTTQIHSTHAIFDVNE